MIKINEIFHSIQGESTWVGCSTVFIRTSGCHLRCTYCDTTYAYNEGDLQSVDEILKAVETYGTPYVCITGGEPLLQKEIFTLMTQLCDLNYKVSLETSGNISCKTVDPRVKKIIDVKTPDSGEPNTFHDDNLPENLKESTVNTEFKFVICSETDFVWSENFMKKHSLNENNTVLYSPSYGKINEKWLAKKILSKKSKARLQLQLHKYIWSPSERGV